MSHHTDNFRTYLEAERRMSPHTVVCYMRDVEGFMEYCETENPAEVAWKDVRGWVMKLTETSHNPSSINRAVSAVRAFFRLMLRQEICTVDPTERFTSLKTKKPLPTFIHESDISKVLEPITVPKDTYDALLERAVIETLYTTGLRRSELLSLTRANVNLAAQTIRVVGKGDKEREIPIIDSLTTTLSALITAQDFLTTTSDTRATSETNFTPLKEEKIWKNDKKFLFLCKSSAPLSQSQLYTMVKRVLERAGIQGKCSPHVLRHTFATHLMGEQVGIRAIQELLGHSSISTTQRYTHTSIQQLKKSYNKAHPRAIFPTKAEE